MKMTQYTKMTASNVYHIMHDGCEIAIVEMSKVDAKEWLQFRTIQEESFYENAEVDQTELSHDGEKVKPKGYSFANFVYTLYQET